MNTTTLLINILVGGGATVIATQILKSKYIPIQFQKFPQQTAAVVSLIAAIIAEYQAHVTVDFSNLNSLVALFIGTLWVAISTYNHLKSRSN